MEKLIYPLAILAYSFFGYSTLICLLFPNVNKRKLVINFFLTIIWPITWVWKYIQHLIEKQQADQRAYLIHLTTKLPNVTTTTLTRVKLMSLDELKEFYLRAKKLQ